MGETETEEVAWISEEMFVPLKTQHQDEQNQLAGYTQTTDIVGKI